jgi:YD repeat-containing protein
LIDSATNDSQNSSWVAKAPIDVGAPIQSQIRFANSTLPNDASSMAYYRPAGSTGAYQVLPQSALSTPGSYIVDGQALAEGNYDVVFIAVSNGGDGRPAGTLLRRNEYQVTISHGATGSSITDAGIPLDAAYNNTGFQYGAAGTYIWQAPQSLRAYNLQSATGIVPDGLIVRTRPTGSTAWTYTSGPVGRDAATGAFTIDFAGNSTDQDVSLVLYKNGQIIDILSAPASFSGSQTPVLNFSFLQDQKTSITFNPPPDTTYLMIKYDMTVDGVVKTVYKRLDKLSAGTFIWATSDDGLIPDPKQSYTYNIVYTAYDAYGTPLSMSKGTVTLGGDVEPTGGRRVTLTGSERPVVIEFVPNADTNNINGPTPGQPLSQAAQINLYYRPSPKNPADYDVPYTLVKLTRNGDGRFLFNTSDYGLPENSEYEYRYDALDASGNVLVERHSYFDTRTRSNPATNTDIIGVITETNKDMTVDRYERYNAFGEVSGERDGRGNWNDLYYNAQGKLIKKQQAEVMITLANGYQQVMRPETLFYYDRTGNLLGLKDANGNLTTQSWNYGTGKVDTSWDAAHDYKTSQYDQLGNLRVQFDELQQKTTYDYSKLGQLTAVTHGSGAQTSIDKYNYDAAGNRIGVTNTLTGITSTYYDGEGRIIHTVSAEGRAVWYQYTWNSSIVSVGGVVSGGWQKIATDANGHTLTDNVDTFGRVTWHQDMGGRTTSYAYNWAGLLASEISSAGKNITYSYYSNGLVRGIDDTGTGTQALYEYDGDGNRTYESYRSLTGSYVYTQAYVSYDSLNRVTSIKDLLYSVSYEYDAVGNRRHMAATYHDYVGNTKQSQDYWYAYDALNRFTLTMGQLSGARATSADDTSVSVVLGAGGGDGVYLAYDAVGQRKLATYASDGRTELYGYDALGYLTTQTINGVKTSERTNDQLGRVTNYAEWLADGSKQVTNLVKTYDADGLQKTERDNLNGSTTTYARLADGTVSQVKVTPDDADKGTAMTSNYTYEWWDGAKQSKVTAQGSNPLAPGWKPASSLYNYDVNGNLKAVFDDGGGEATKQRAFSYETDQQGQVLRRNELGGVIIDANNQITGAASGRIHNFYYLNGHRIGNVGNDGIEKIDYAQELAGKLDKGSDDQYKIFKPISSVDFDENYMKISSQYPSMNASSWTVRAGDTLQSIASALWGDSTLWYLLADANGLKSSDEVLRAGQLLTVPNVITNLHNTANTFKPYDPGMAIGNTQPTLPTPPPPPNKEACGGFGTMIAMVVAIVAAYFTAGAALAALGSTATSIAGAELGVAMAAGAAAGAVGSIAAQGTLIATGDQKGFDWKGVALGAVGGAISAGLPNLASNAFVNGALQGAVGGALTQGIGVATGAQHSFDWKGVAVSAIARGIGQGIDAEMLGAGYSKMDARLVGGFAGGVASAVARGGSLGRNIGAVTMDAVASTIGNSVVDQMAATSTQKIYGYDDGNTQVGPDFRLAGASNDATGFRSGYSSSGNMATDTDQGPPGNSRDGGIAIPQRAAQSAINLQAGDSSLPSMEISGNRSRAIAGSNGGDYVTYFEDVGDGGMVRQGQIYHRGALSVADDVLANAQQSVSNFFGGVNAYVQNSSLYSGLQKAASPVMSKVAADSINGVINLGRMLTSNDMLPNTVTAVTHPFETANAALNRLNQSSRTDILAGGIGMILPFAGSVGRVGEMSTIFKGANAALVDSEVSALQRMAANNLAGSPAADLRSAYQQTKGQVDFAHIEADVRFNSAGGLQGAKGGHFSTSPLVDIIPGTELVGANGSMWAKINLKGPDGNWYLKTNNNGFSSLTPDTWSLAQAKGEMSQAFLGRTQLPNGNWMGSSSGVNFRFHPPTKNVPLWRGFPEYTP